MALTRIATSARNVRRGMRPATVGSIRDIRIERTRSFRSSRPGKARNPSEGAEANNVRSLESDGTIRRPKPVVLFISKPSTTTTYVVGGVPKVPMPVRRPHLQICRVYSPQFHRHAPLASSKTARMGLGLSVETFLSAVFL